jgi:hypothetical protein
MPSRAHRLLRLLRRHRKESVPVHMTTPPQDPDDRRLADPRRLRQLASALVDAVPAHHVMDITMRGLARTFAACAARIEEDERELAKWARERDFDPDDLACVLKTATLPPPPKLPTGLEDDEPPTKPSGVAMLRTTPNGFAHDVYESSEAVPKVSRPTVETDESPFPIRDQYPIPFPLGPEASEPDLYTRLLTQPPPPTFVQLVSLVSAICAPIASAVHAAKESELKLPAVPEHLNVVSYEPNERVAANLKAIAEGLDADPPTEELILDLEDK